MAGLGLIGRARARIHAVLASNLSPRQLFWAMLVGAIVGATPLYGLHLSVCIVLCWALRLNMPATYAAANISLPPLIPFLGFACVQIGERLLRGQWLSLRIEDFRVLAQGPGGVRALMLRFFVDWAIGGLAVGAAIGLLLGTIVYAIALRRPSANQAATPSPSPSDLNADAGPGADSTTITAAITTAIKAASRRYHRAPRNLRCYAFFKYRLDPSYRRIAALVPERSFTVDLGTGLGMLPLLLVLLPGEREALGVDWDATKLAAGRLAGSDLARLRLVEGDARQFAIPPCDVITLVDVLHYYEPATQRALLERAASALRPGGSLLIREGDAATRSGGATWTRAIEALAVRIGWNRGDGDTKFRGAATLAAELESLGLRVTVEPLAGKLHPGNVLLSARKPGGTDRAAADAPGDAATR